MMVLVLSGDADVFQFVKEALDPDDPATGTSVPVLVLPDSGGAAHDIYTYILDCPGTWDAAAATRRLPTVDGKGRDADYCGKAANYLPEILRLGKLTGQNSKRQLDFFVLSKVLLSSCPTPSHPIPSHSIPSSHTLSHALLIPSHPHPWLHLGLRTSSCARISPSRYRRRCSTIAQTNMRRPSLQSCGANPRSSR
jgi:hypothetical protein